MWLVRRAMRHPIAVIVAVLAITLSAALAVRRIPVDIFPNLGVPVIYVVQPYGGMSPSQMEGQIVTYYEYHFLYINGIEHIESQSIQGMAMLKLYFHPGTDISQSMAQVTAMAFRATSFMPPGTLPPFIVRFDAGSIPVGQLVFSSDQRNDTEIQDLALYRVRPLLATLPGVSAPPPSGGRIRTIVVYVNPDRLRLYRMSPEEVAAAIARANLTLPAGNVRLGDYTTIAATNAMVQKISDLDNVPLRTGPGPSVFLRDVGRVEDGSDIVYNIALVNGRRTVYLPLTKRADASTLDVVNNIKGALPKMRELVPPDVEIRFEFDQSVYVKNALQGLHIEGALGALLAGIVVFLFLRNWRSGFVVIFTIPFSLMAAVVGLRLAGQTINIMTIGGLALSVGILVDQATVAIENIHTHLARGKKIARAVTDAMDEVTIPQFLSMLVVVTVFIPSFFMVGIGRALFPPLALAVGLAMLSSYLLSSTLVPILATWLLAGNSHASSGKALPFFERGQERYARFIDRVMRSRRRVLQVYLLVCVSTLLLGGFLGVELFPRVDTGQFQLRVRAPDGTRLERTEEIVHGVDQSIREEVGPTSVKMTLANIGNPPWSYPVNGIYVWNSGPHEALLLVALRPGHRPPLHEIEDSLRKKLSARFPDVRFSFEAGDIVSQILNFGAPTPIQIAVSGNNLGEAVAFARKIAAALSKIGSLRDVQIPQSLDYPTLNVTIDRERAGQFGVTVDRVGRSIVAATSSSVLITPMFWTNPATGIPYRVAVRVPENEIRSIEDLRSLAVMPNDAPRPLLEDIATIVPGKTFGEIDHRNSQRTITLTANAAGDDLGRAAALTQKAIEEAGKPPRGTTVELHGQVEQMRTTLNSLREGLALSVLVILLLLCANFQSLRDSLAVLAVLPAVLAGIIVALFVTRSTLNVESLMGAVMSIGVSAANAILLVTFARVRRQAGDDPATASTAAARARLRPILMTSLAMIAGMIPMALGFGEGGEQTAPLGRAVIGGLSASLIATLLVLPVLYTMIAVPGAVHSPSLDPDDPNSPQFERRDP